MCFSFGAVFFILNKLIIDDIIFFCGNDIYFFLTWVTVYDTMHVAMGH